ncbi:MAG: hypothetical protein ACFFBP_08820 [Promethearchaeota archaeon]
MSQNSNYIRAKNDNQNQKYYEQYLAFGEKRAEMLRLEILYQKILKKFEV